MGVYSSFQFLGPFIGGVTTGILMSKISLSATIVFGILLSIIFLWLSFSLSANLLKKEESTVSEAIKV